jgi:hypothetical protein
MFAVGKVCILISAAKPGRETSGITAREHFKVYSMYTGSDNILEASKLLVLRKFCVFLHGKY